MCLVNNSQNDNWVKKKRVFTEASPEMGAFESKNVILAIARTTKKHWSSSHMELALIAKRSPSSTFQSASS